MIYTHIFLVIVATIILIIFAEHQKLRKITWILLIGCLTYIILIIEPESTKPAITENDEQSMIDSIVAIKKESKPNKSEPVVNDTISTPENIVQDISKEIQILDNVKDINVLSISMAKEIVNKMPVGESGIFLNDITTLFCFTAVDNAIQDNKIVHTWKHNKQDYLKSFITVGDSPNWRCWSRITIRPEMTGDWQVVVSDSMGNYLDSIEFSIIPAYDQLN